MRARIVRVGKLVEYPALPFPLHLLGKVTRKQVMEIVKLKLNDMNATTEEAAFRTISGTARSMGIEVTA